MIEIKAQEHANYSNMRISAIIAYGILIAAVATCVAGIGIWSVASSKKEEKKLLLEQIYSETSNNNIKNDMMYYAMASNLLNVEHIRHPVLSLEEFIKMLHRIAIPQITIQHNTFTIKDLAAYMRYNNDNKRYIECMLYFSIDAASTNRHKAMDNIKFKNIIDNLVIFDTTKFYSQCILHRNIQHIFHLKYLFALCNAMVEMYTRMSKTLMEIMCAVCPQYLRYYCEHVLSIK